ncbi:3980_t:CDS:1, partial [Gigaspora margarita]
TISQIYAVNMKLTSDNEIIADKTDETNSSDNENAVEITE